MHNLAQNKTNFAKKNLFELKLEPSLKFPGYKKSKLVGLNQVIFQDRCIAFKIHQ